MTAILDAIVRSFEVHMAYSERVLPLLAISAEQIRKTLGDSILPARLIALNSVWPCYFPCRHFTFNLPYQALKFTLWATVGALYTILSTLFLYLLKFYPGSHVEHFVAKMATLDCTCFSKTFALFSFAEMLFYPKDISDADISL